MLSTSLFIICLYKDVDGRTIYLRHDRSRTYANEGGIGVQRLHINVGGAEKKLRQHYFYSSQLGDKI
jgi:hypothetical protein